MNKKIKIIELLNKIANGEKIPKKIKYCNYIWEAHNKRYFRDGIDMLEDYLSHAIIESLNDEVEILEDNIEEIQVSKEGIIIAENAKWKGRKLDIELVNKINELVRALNQLREDVDK